MQDELTLIFKPVNLPSQQFQTRFVYNNYEKNWPCFIVQHKSKKGIPDVSRIKADISLERFDQDFFSIDTNNIPFGLQKIQQEHPGFYWDFMREILGVNGSDTSLNTLLITKDFLRGYLPVYDSLQLTYKKTDWLEKELKKGFQFVKYYFPKYKFPNKVITFVGPFDGYSDVLTASWVLFT